LAQQDTKSNKAAADTAVKPEFAALSKPSLTTLTV
jgi:hypothetical protein